ncbi:hypothetical protein SAMN02745704_01345 [Paucidesulfovibrio gracilis DSM 16080]|uniref:LPP20 lipoprotein n=1 Tax=Paucidesulfovibrio gracilis DSM 16080 TaxID=1121449 RepID=A0A1T4WSP8_9BACT|nr:hypothetical protein [Paucidesulfovibrio gracilis]SKA80390.1 hypothetical protein SAMN02745704_01345 [Paucidesulfovibrio gracilis DSM 16080]
MAYNILMLQLVLVLLLPCAVLAQTSASTGSTTGSVPVVIGEEEGAAGGAETAGPSGQPSALDQVENWINENVPPEDRESFPVPEASAESTDVGLTLGDGSVTVDWGTGMLSALGTAVASGEGYNPARAEAMAMRHATLQARKFLQDAVLGLALNGRELLVDNLTPAQQTQLRGKLQNSPIERASEPGDNGDVLVSVVARVRLRGELADALVPRSIPFQSRIPTKVEAPILEPLAEQDMDAVEYKRSMAELGAFTGVIVDARGMEGAPALLPELFDPEGVAVYGPFMASRSMVLEQGLVTYADSPDAPLVRRRCGGTPLEVRAQAVAGPQRADLFLSATDAELVRLLFESEEISTTCPVAVLLD